jgi:hypothetical protein
LQQISCRANNIAANMVLYSNFHAKIWLMQFSASHLDFSETAENLKLWDFMGVLFWC